MRNQSDASRDVARVAVIDQDALVIDAIERKLLATADLHVVSSWNRLDEAFGSWAEGCPDLAVLDTTLLGTEPLSTLDAIRDTFGVPLLLRVRQPRLDFVHLTLRAGAAGVLGGGASADETVRALRTIAAGASYAPRELRKALFDRAATGAAVPYLTLSRREREVAALTAGGATAKQVGDRFFISEPTVRTHQRKVYEKLGVRKPSGVLAALIGLGVLDPAGAATDGDDGFEDLLLATA